MTKEEVSELLNEFGNKSIAVVGDMIVDYYRILKPKRLSPEAPVVMFEPEKEEYKAGGASNVAENLYAMGAGNVNLVTVLGEDQHILLPKNSIWVEERSRLTTVKERIVTRRQQICRIDIQSNTKICKATAMALFDKSKNALLESDAIIFSDYDHGVCTIDLIQPIMQLAKERGIKTIVDSKAKDTLSKYKGATIALPNMDEARMMTKLDDFEDEDIAKFLLRTMNLDAAAITLGPRGILLAMRDIEPQIFAPLHENINNEVIDVTGAGDTVAAMVAAGVTLDMTYPQMLRLANVAAGIKVQKRGVDVATKEEIIAAIELNHIDI